MSHLIINPSPQDPTLPTTEDSDGSAAFLTTGLISEGNNFILTTLELGSVIKGVVRSLVWIMFEVPFPKGTRFAEMWLGLTRNITVGDGDLAIWIGFLETDGVWNEGGDNGTGWLEYTNIEDLPHPATATDSAWLNASPSLAHTIGFGDHINGELVKWGTNSPGLHYEDPKFLTDFQTAFDENEAFRTSRGVPIAMSLVPVADNNRLFRFTSNRPEAAPVVEFPKLFFRTRRIHIV